MFTSGPMVVITFVSKTHTEMIGFLFGDLATSEILTIVKILQMTIEFGKKRKIPKLIGGLENNFDFL
jgi:ABC-type Co2+ transport system permease subunit